MSTARVLLFALRERRCQEFVPCCSVRQKGPAREWFPAMKVWRLSVREQRQTQEWLGEPGLEVPVPSASVLVVKEEGASPLLVLAGCAGLVAEGQVPQFEVLLDAEGVWMRSEEDLKADL